jgi:hypothetical protein
LLFPPLIVSAVCFGVSFNTGTIQTPHLSAPRFRRDLFFNKRAHSNFRAPRVSQTGGGLRHKTHALADVSWAGYAKCPAL